MRQILFAIVLCTIPMSLAHAAPPDGGVADASAVVAPVKVTPSVSVSVPADPATIDPGATSTAIVNAVNSRDWQVAIAGLLSLAWLLFLRFGTDTSSFFHTMKGKALVTCVSSVVGAVIPPLQTHQFTVAMLVSAVTAAGFSFMMVVAPHPASDSPAAPPAQPTQGGAA